MAVDGCVLFVCGLLWRRCCWLSVFVGGGGLLFVLRLPLAVAGWYRRL